MWASSVAIVFTQFELGFIIYQTTKKKKKKKSSDSYPNFEMIQWLWNINI